MTSDIATILAQSGTDLGNVDEVTAYLKAQDYLPLPSALMQIRIDAHNIRQMGKAWRRSLAGKGTPTMTHDQDPALAPMQDFEAEAKQLAREKLMLAIRVEELEEEVRKLNIRLLLERMNLVEFFEKARDRYRGQAQ